MDLPFRVAGHILQRFCKVLQRILVKSNYTTVMHVLDIFVVLSVWIFKYFAFVHYLINLKSGSALYHAFGEMELN